MHGEGVPRTLVEGHEFERAWLRGVTLKHLQEPKTAKSARELSDLFDRVAASDALRAIARHPGRRFTCSEGGERVEAIFDHQAHLVSCTYTRTRQDGSTATWSIGQLHLDVGAASLWAGGEPDGGIPGRLDHIDSLLAAVYREAVGDDLGTVLLDVAEYAWRLHLLGQVLDPASAVAGPRRHGRSNDRERLRAHSCRVAVHLFTEPGSDLRAVAERIVASWNGSAPDLLTASREVLAQ